MQAWHLSVQDREELHYRDVAIIIISIIIFFKAGNPILL